MSRLFAWLNRVFAATLLSPNDLVADESVQRVARIGYVGQLSASDAKSYFSAFRDQLKKLGYVERRNLIIEARWADGHTDRLPALMAEMLEHKVDVIVTSATPGAIAAKKATSTIPIVATSMADPVRTGLALSLARPGGNLTGMSMGYSEELGGKWLELLQDTIPRLRTVAVVANPDNPAHEYLTKDVKTAAPRRRLKLRFINVRKAEALPGAFKQAREGAQAMLVIGDAVTLRHQLQITSLAAEGRIPVMYNVRSFAGGLMAYSPDVKV